GNFRTWTPTPPERGSFPLDHDGECKVFMDNYLKCMKFTENKNAPNCRILAKQYLKCRMDNQLMEQSDWESLGLVNLPGEKHVDIGKKYNQDKDKQSSSSSSTNNTTTTTTTTK
ncbi:Cytochrome c oxidase assembly protein COX19, partial [Candida tropicalis]